MLRILSLSGMTGLFLLISPKLRMTVQSSIDSGVTYMSVYAPWSYCAAVALALVCACATLYRGAQPR